MAVVKKHEKCVSVKNPSHVTPLRRARALLDACIDLEQRAGEIVDEAGWVADAIRDLSLVSRGRRRS